MCRRSHLLQFTLPFRFDDEDGAMTDSKSIAEKCLQSPTSIEQNSTTCENSNLDNLDVSMSGEKDRQSASNVVNKTVEIQQASSNLTKKKVKKPKKKKSETASATSSSINNNNDNNNSGEGASAHLSPLYQSSLPIYCKKCLGRNVGKKGERSDAYVITCSKCGAHEVLMKPDGNGVVKISDPGFPETLPQGDLLDAAWKSAGDKAMSALELKEEDYPREDEQMSSRISVLSQCVYFIFKSILFFLLLLLFLLIKVKPFLLINLCQVSRIE